jgi:hypothetical protein
VELHQELQQEAAGQEAAAAEQQQAHGEPGAAAEQQEQEQQAAAERARGAAASPGPPRPPEQSGAAAAGTAGEEQLQRIANVEDRLAALLQRGRAAGFSTQSAGGGGGSWGDASSAGDQHQSAGGAGTAGTTQHQPSGTSWNQGAAAQQPAAASPNSARSSWLDMSREAAIGCGTFSSVYGTSVGLQQWEALSASPAFEPLAPLPVVDSSRCPLAVKQTSSHPAALEHIQAEFQIYKSIQQTKQWLKAARIQETQPTRLLQCHGLIQDGGRRRAQLLLQPLPPGAVAFERLPFGIFSTAQQLELCTQLLDIVNELQCLGLAHCDISPSNVMAVPCAPELRLSGWWLLLLDLGSAVVLSHPGGPQPPGPMTPIVAPPECAAALLSASRPLWATHMTDLWQVACLMGRLLVGQWPWEFLGAEVTDAAVLEHLDLLEVSGATDDNLPVPADSLRLLRIRSEASYRLLRVGWERHDFRGSTAAMRTALACAMLGG